MVIYQEVLKKKILLRIFQMIQTTKFQIESRPKWAFLPIPTPYKTLKLTKIKHEGGG